MSKKISSIEGIGEATTAKLEKAGITTVEALLEKGGQKAGRKEIADTSGMSESVVLDFVNMADLFRINGVAGQFAELLKASGVDTVKELATRNAENLWAKLTEVNTEKSLTKVVPSAEKITDFITQAGKLDQKVFH